MSIVPLVYRIILKELKNSHRPNKYFIQKRLKQHILLNKELSGKHKNDAIDGLFVHLRYICESGKNINKHNNKSEFKNLSEILYHI